jgi:hypothetical protein
VRSALVIALGVAFLALPAQAARSTDSATRTIRLVSTTVSLRAVVDRAPRGVPNKGDVVQERSLLRNAVRQFERAKGAPVGSDVATYTVVSVNPVRMRMKLTVRLPGGTLRGTAQVVGNTSSVIRIVGGTRNFANARGTGEVRAQTAGAKGVLNIYRLQLP